ncbi:MAG: hypothetical protein JSS81_26795 [Acidobacteria bacterium]|nr:hypothetical protein [Acidobacteriota bacterium]
MFSDEIEVSVTYGTRITFFLRMIGIAEENAIRQKTFGKTEAEKEEFEYQKNVDVLAELATKLPEGMFKDAVPRCSTEEAVRGFFKEKTALNERIAYFAVRGYFLRLLPSESFL